MSSLLPAYTCVYMSNALHFFSLCGCWHAFCQGWKLPLLLLCVFPLSQLKPCSTHGWFYTSIQCLRYPGLCRRWSMPPGHPNLAAQSLGSQRWQIHWPSKTAWQQCEPGRTPPPWRRHLTPPDGVSGDTLMPQRTTLRERERLETLW